MTSNRTKKMRRRERERKKNEIRTRSKRKDGWASILCDDDNLVSWQPQTAHLADHDIAVDSILPLTMSSSSSSLPVGQLDRLRMSNGTLAQLGVGCCASQSKSWLCRFNPNGWVAVATRLIRAGTTFASNWIPIPKRFISLGRPESATRTNENNQRI